MKILVHIFALRTGTIAAITALVFQATIFCRRRLHRSNQALRVVCAHPHCVKHFLRRHHAALNRYLAPGCQIALRILLRIVVKLLLPLLVGNLRLLLLERQLPVLQIHLELLHLLVYQFLLYTYLFLV